MNPIRIVAASLGVMFAVSGFIHGYYAALQAPAAMPGLFFDAIGPEQRYWLHGDEPAFALLPTFLATGIGAMTLAVAVALWSLFGIQRRGGAHVFLALMVLLTLTGGGVGHVLFFLPTWAWATRINSDLAWWRQRVPRPARFGRAWGGLLVATLACWLIAQEIAVFGWVPGISDPEILLYVCWSFLLAALIGLNLAFPAAIAARLNPPAR